MIRSMTFMAWAISAVTFLSMHPYEQVCVIFICWAGNYQPNATLWDDDKHSPIFGFIGRSCQSQKISPIWRDYQERRLAINCKHGWKIFIRNHIPARSRMLLCICNKRYARSAITFAVGRVRLCRSLLQWKPEATSKLQRSFSTSSVSVLPRHQRRASGF